MNIKMIVTDLDRTLLRSDKTISGYSADILNRCRELGIKVVFATARPKRTVNHFVDNIPADALILHNGAVIYSENKLLGNYGIASDVRDNILLSISRDFPDATLSVEIDDVFYANFDVSTVWNYTQAIRTDFTDLPDKPADKIIIGVSSFEDIETFSKYLTDDLYIEMSDGKLGLIMHRKATKWEAVKITAAHFNISISEIAAFGDDYNDISMLRECGIGVAVNNALDEVKAVADYICDANDNDGAAKWIEEKTDLFSPVTTPDSSQCEVRTAEPGALKAYRFVVIFARYQDKWLYCSAKNREANTNSHCELVYETAGGHIEEGETTLEAAKRELYEETGAVKFDITPVFDYSVHYPNVYSNGQVFLAQIYELGDIPDYETAITGVKLFDAMPDTMRFPQILPVLYEKMQNWLNLQSAKDEIWDVYDCERRPAGRTHRRADPLPIGDYHLVVHVWMVNSRGEFLITKRAPNKGYPNMWECTGGSAVSGDDSIAAAVREVKEETGLDVLPENGACVFTLTRDDSICDVWLFRQDFDVRDVVLQENETTGAKYASKDQIRQMIENNEFIAFHYIEELFQKAGELFPHKWFKEGN